MPQRRNERRIWKKSVKWLSKNSGGKCLTYFAPPSYNLVDVKNWPFEYRCGVMMMAKNRGLVIVLKIIAALSIIMFFVSYIVQSMRQYAQIFVFAALLCALGIYALTKKK